MARKFNTISALLGQTEEAPEKTKETAGRSSGPEPRKKKKPKVEYKTERVQILLRKSTKRALKTLANRQTKGSLNELINEICEAYIEEHKRK